MPRVLIVEDERPLRRIIMLNLTRRGFTVTEAEDAHSAFETMTIAERGGLPFDALLLDINLPNCTGWDLLRQIRDSKDTLRSPPRVIVMTALRPAQQRLAEFHPDSVLLKPFPIDALLRLVERMTEKSNG